MYIVICDNTPEVICKLMEEEEEEEVSFIGGGNHRIMSMMAPTRDGDSHLFKHFRILAITIGKE